MITSQPLHPLKHDLQIFTDASKEGWGAHLNEHMARGNWSLPESKLHINYLELKAVLLALKEFQAICTHATVLIATDNTKVVAYINKEGGMKSGPTMENSDLVCQKTDYSQRSTHSRPSECDSRQTIQTGPDHSNRMVPQSRNLPSYMSPVAPTHCGPVCHQVQQQATTVCLTGSRPPGMGSGCSQPVMGRTGPLCLSTSSHLGQSGGEVTGLPLQQNHTDCTGMAQHALVLRSSGNVQPDSPVSAQHTQPSVSTIQPDPTQEPVKSESACLAPRATAIKEQGFSEAVAARIEAPQRGSNRSVYEAKWTIFTKSRS